MAETRLSKKNERSGGPAGMMNPWISTSLPPQDLIVWVTSKFALSESTSWANVSRGTSPPCADPPRCRHASPRQAASAVWSLSIAPTLRQWRKILRHVRSIRQDGGQQSCQGAQEDDAAEDHGFQRTDTEEAHNESTSRGEHGRADVGNAVSAQDPGGASEARESAGLQQNDAQNGRPASAHGAHGGDLTFPLEGGAVDRHEQVQQHDDGHSSQDHRENLLGQAQEVEDAEQDSTGEDRLSFGGDVEPPVQARQVRHALGPNEDGGQRLDFIFLETSFIFPKLQRET